MADDKSLQMLPLWIYFSSEESSWFKLNFFPFSINQIFWMTTLQATWFNLVAVVLITIFLRVCRTESYCLNVCYWPFDGWDNLIESDSEVQNIGTHLPKLINKFNIRIKVIKIHHKNFGTIFIMSANEEIIVIVPEPYTRLKLLNL